MVMVIAGGGTMTAGAMAAGCSFHIAGSRKNRGCLIQAAPIAKDIQPLTV